MKKHKLLGEERRREIIRILDADGRITVDDLVRRFAVSAVTARADLDILSEAGALVRSHGGAVRRLDPGRDYPLKFKETLHAAQKACIAQASVQFIEQNQTIILDSGTTTAQIARQLKMRKIKPLTVITNALNIGFELANAPGISLIMIGGILRKLSNSFVGPQAERMLEELHADHLFLAVDGLDPLLGLSTPDILEAQLNSLMIRISNQTTVVADASKLGRRSLSLIAGMECVKRVITDDRISPEMAGKFREKGVELVVA